MTSYAREMQERRQADKRYVRDEVLNDGERATFTGLTHLPPDERYIFRLRPDLIPEPVSVERPTSKGLSRPFLKIGTVRVPFPEGEATLTLFASLEDTVVDHPFLSFEDTTNGQETHGAGRNLSWDGELLLLDFNRACNPYCAYGDRWNCVLPPAENRLTFAVPVGQLRYGEHL